MTEVTGRSRTDEQPNRASLPAEPIEPGEREQHIRALVPVQVVAADEVANQAGGVPAAVFVDAQDL